MRRHPQQVSPSQSQPRGVPWVFNTGSSRLAHVQVKDGRGGRLGGGQLAGVDGVDDRARVAQLDARAHAVAPARPPAQGEQRAAESAWVSRSFMREPTP